MVAPHPRLVFLIVFVIGVVCTLDARQRGRGGPPLPVPPIDAHMSKAELAAALDAYLAGLARANDFAGVVLVAQNGETVFERAYGLADRERNIPMSAHLRFNYASIGKAFTRAAIGQLIAAGRVKLTDTLGNLLPDYPNVDAKPATVEQLLAFQVGIADFFGDAFARADKSQFQANRDFYAFVAPKPLAFLPGERTLYCNGCYIVLGEIIAKVAGLPYERYVEERVFKPAGMKTAGFLTAADANVAPGYTRASPSSPWTSAASQHPARGSAAGGSFGGVRDLLAFDSALRTHTFFDARTTAWFLRSEAAAGPRALARYAIAGGAPGANTSLESGAGWTIVTLGNLDPPNASRVGRALATALFRDRP
jgi:D-alanyl-D-alanine carboxypeptidase